MVPFRVELLLRQQVEEGFLGAEDGAGRVQTLEGFSSDRGLGVLMLLPVGMEKLFEEMIRRWTTTR